MLGKEFWAPSKVLASADDTSRIKSKLEESSRHSSRTERTVNRPPPSLLRQNLTTKGTFGGGPSSELLTSRLGFRRSCMQRSISGDWNKNRWIYVWRNISGERRLRKRFRRPVTKICETSTTSRSAGAILSALSCFFGHWLSDLNRNIKGSKLLLEPESKGEGQSAKVLAVLEALYISWVGTKSFETLTFKRKTDNLISHGIIFGKRSKA